MLIALVFSVLVGRAVLFRQHVIDTSLLSEYREGRRILPFAVDCIGAQALLSGPFAAFSRLSPLTFFIYGIALLPFFGFSYYFSDDDPAFTRIGLLAAVGNIILLVLCYAGSKQCKLHEQGGDV